MNILCVIPARGGSKGVPKKNVRDVCGRPLISYSIGAALACGDCFHRVIVSTDGDEIASVARECGADVPFLRPTEFATDTATSLSVMQHAVREVEAQDGVNIDWTLLVQATNPLVIEDDIRASVDLACTSDGATSVVSVQDAMDYHPIKLKTIDGGLLRPFVDGAPEMIRRQDIETAVYKRNGSLYMTRRDVLMDQDDLYGDTIVPYIMPQNRSIDIDTEHDLKMAEFMISKKGRV